MSCSYTFPALVVIKNAIP